MHPTTILWVVTLHQIAIAVSLASILWLLLGKRLWVAVIATVIICLLWTPNLLATTEYTFTGANTNSLAISDAIGLTPYLNGFYATVYNCIGYNFKPLLR